MGILIIGAVSLLFAALWWNVGNQLGRWLRGKFGNWAGWVLVVLSFILLGVYCLNPYAAINGLGLFVGSVCATFAKIQKSEKETGRREADSSATKKCPQCAETIQYEAAVCRFCGHTFSEDEMAQIREDVAARAAAEDQKAKEEQERQEGLSRSRKARACRFFAWILAVISGFLLIACVGAMFADDPKSRLDPVVAIVPILLFVVLPGLGAWNLFKKAKRLKTTSLTNGSTPTK